MDVICCTATGWYSDMNQSQVSYLYKKRVCYNTYEFTMLKPEHNVWIFCYQHFQTHLHDRELVYFDWNFTEMHSQGGEWYFLIFPFSFPFPGPISWGTVLTTKLDTILFSWSDDVIRNKHWDPSTTDSWLSECLLLVGCQVMQVPTPWYHDYLAIATTETLSESKNQCYVFIYARETPYKMSLITQYYI